jgi:hypothetical protein
MEAMLPAPKALTGRARRMMIAMVRIVVEVLKEGMLANVLFLKCNFYDGRKLVGREFIFVAMCVPSTKRFVLGLVGLRALPRGAAPGGASVTSQICC